MDKKKWPFKTKIKIFCESYPQLLATLAKLKKVYGVWYKYDSLPHHRYIHINRDRICVFTAYGNDSTSNSGTLTPITDLVSSLGITIWDD